MPGTLPGMGIYSHLTDAELSARRDSLLAGIEAAAGGVASVSNNGRSVSYQGNLSEARRLLDAVQAEINLRAGVRSRGPIYLV